MRRMRVLVAGAMPVTLTLVACGEKEACAQKPGGTPPAPARSPTPAPKAPTPAPAKAPAATTPGTRAPAATTPGTATRATTASKPPPTTPKAAGLAKPSVSSSQARRYPGTVRPTVVFVPQPPLGFYLGDPFSPFNPYNRWNPLSPFYGYYYYGHAERRPCTDAPPTPAVTEPQPNDFTTTNPPPG